MRIRMIRSSRGRLACGLAFALFTAGEAGRAQQIAGPGARGGPAPSGTAVIVGQVTEAGTTRPIAGVTVAMGAAPPTGFANGAMGDAIAIDRLMSMDLGNVLSGMRQTITDGQGRFAFTNLPKGSYSLQATKPGWTTGGYGQLRPDSQPIPLVLSDADALGNVALQLWKFSTVSGTIVDEAGDPIVGLGVRALRRTWLAGKPRLVAASMAQTDDRGMYRLSSLVPGDYLIAVPQTMVTSPAGGAGPAVDIAGLQAMIANRGASADPTALMAMVSSMSSGSSSGIRVGDWVIQTSAMGARIIPPVIGVNGKMLAYQTTFFPTSTSAAQASIMTLGSGDDRPGIDFQLRPTAVLSLAGTVTGPDGAVPGVAVRLVPTAADELSPDGFDTAATTTNSSGAFVFLAVPPGQYTLRVLKVPPVTAPPPMTRPDMSMIQNASGGIATSMGSMTMDMILPAPPAIPSTPTLWATMPVSVGDADVTGVAVPLRPGVRISGRLAFDGSDTPPAISQFRRVPVLLDRAGTGGFGPAGAAALGGARSDGGQFDEAGQFSTYGVVPGKYFVRVPFSVNGWMLKSAALGGKDLADVAITIENADVGGVVLTFTDRISELSGTVRNAQGNPDGESSVVLFPTDSAAWVEFGSAPRRIRSVRTSKDGQYRFTGLPPGDYLAVAVRGDAGMDWQNPAFLEAVSRAATKVTIAEGDKKAQDLRTSR